MRCFGLTQNQNQWISFNFLQNTPRFLSELKFHISNREYSSYEENSDTLPLVELWNFVNLPQAKLTVSAEPKHLYLFFFQSKTKVHDTFLVKKKKKPCNMFFIKVLQVFLKQQNFWKTLFKYLCFSFWSVGQQAEWTSLYINWAPTLCKAMVSVDIISSTPLCHLSILFGRMLHVFSWILFLAS